MTPPVRGIVILTDQFPARSETFIANEARALRRAGHELRLEAIAHARESDLAAAGELAATYWEDDGIARRLVDLAWLAGRHPLRCLADLRDRRRWRAQESPMPLRSLAPAARRLVRHGDLRVHVHFAGAAALCALRLARLVGVPYSVTAHAYDIYKQPRNLVEKLERAGFATSGCTYTVADLRAMASVQAARRIHPIVMGVDGERFHRRGAHGRARTVLAVGRLVEKKGLADLVEATALLGAGARPDRVLIVGDGELREDLRARAERLGVADRVRLLGWRTPAEVRDLLEQVAILVMPCVIASDGDRDSMPVVVKEALAMEVPVLATDEVGLPEVVRPAWGRLVPPHDPPALATAMTELLDLPLERRAAMGAAGRRFVLQACDVDREAAKLARLLAGLTPSPAPRPAP